MDKNKKGKLNDLRKTIHLMVFLISLVVSTFIYFLIEDYHFMQFMVLFGFFIFLLYFVSLFFTNELFSFELVEDRLIIMRLFRIMVIDVNNVTRIHLHSNFSLPTTSKGYKMTFILKSGININVRFAYGMVKLATMLKFFNSKNVSIKLKGSSPSEFDDLYIFEGNVNGNHKTRSATP